MSLNTMFHFSSCAIWFFSCRSCSFSRTHFSICDYKLRLFARLTSRARPSFILELLLAVQRIITPAARNHKAVRLLADSGFSLHGCRRHAVRTQSHRNKSLSRLNGANLSALVHPDSISFTVTNKTLPPSSSSPFVMMRDSTGLAKICRQSIREY